MLGNIVGLLILLAVCGGLIYAAYKAKIGPFRDRTVAEKPRGPHWQDRQRPQRPPDPPPPVTPAPPPPDVPPAA